MIKFEYKMVRLEYHKAEDILNKLGTERWELVSVAVLPAGESGDAILGFLKRHIKITKQYLGPG